MTCKNCNTELTGNFCENCGQKANTQRITFKLVAHDFIHAFTHADKGFLLLIKQLAVKPGIVAKEYLEGKRKKYFSPLTFMVIVMAFHAFVTYKIGYFQALRSMDPRVPQIWKDGMEIMVQNEKLLALILIVPLITFFTWLFFISSKRNVAEIFVLVAFVMGQVTVIRILFAIPVFLIVPSAVGLINNIVMGVMFIYFLVAFKQFFGQNILLIVLKTVFITILYILFYWIFILSFVYVRNQLF